MENLGLIVSLMLLMYLALKGVNVILASLICAILVAVTNGLPITAALLDHYSTGPLGLFSFAGKFFLLFICGAIFGRLMAESKAALSLALALKNTLGTERVLWIVMLVCALLTYGGVVVFIAVFTIYPLGVELVKAANIPKRLLCGAFILGAGTFTMTALPGTPSIHNVISASALGTDLFAGSGLGMLASIIMIVLGMWYLEREKRIAKENGEGFEASAEELAQLNTQHDYVPSWQRALIPLVIVLSTIIVPRVLLQLDNSWANEQSMFAQMLQFSKAQPIFWPCIALTLASLSCLLLFKPLRGKALIITGEGSNDAIMPLMNTAAVIGFGGVVVQTVGFEQFTQMITDNNLPPLLSLFFSVSSVSGIVGSASGGLQIFMSSQADSFLNMGISPEILHRIATIASGGLDSLPHSGAVIAILSVMKLTHKEAYKDIAVTTIVVPIITVFILISVIGIFNIN